MKTLPVELLVEDRHALVIGGDDECSAKVERLLDAGARVHVVSEEAVHPNIEAHALRGVLELSRRAVEHADVERAIITFVGPHHRAVGRRLFANAAPKGGLLCCLDYPEASTFVNPSVTSVSGLRLSLSSGGQSPGVLKRLREDLVAALDDPRLARFVERLGALRRSLPADQRKSRLQGAVTGFGLAAQLTFPSWFEAGADPPNGHETPQ